MAPSTRAPRPPSRDGGAPPNPRRPSAQPTGGVSRPPAILIGGLLLAGVIVVAGRSLAQPLQRLFRLSEELPPCGRVINRWANQRLEASRDQLEKRHGPYRATGEAANTVTATMTWIDDRIIDHMLEGERQQLRAMARRSASCLPRFDP